MPKTHEHRAPGAVEWLLCGDCGAREYQGVEEVTPCPECGSLYGIGTGWVCCFVPDGSEHQEPGRSTS